MTRILLGACALMLAISLASAAPSGQQVPDPTPPIQPTLSPPVTPTTGPPPPDTTPVIVTPVPSDPAGPLPTDGPPPTNVPPQPPSRPPFPGLPQIWIPVAA